MLTFKPVPAMRDMTLPSSPVEHEREIETRCSPGSVPLRSNAGSIGIASSLLLIDWGVMGSSLGEPSPAGGSIADGRTWLPVSGWAASKANGRLA